MTLNPITDAQSTTQQICKHCGEPIERDGSGWNFWRHSHELPRLQTYGCRNKMGTYAEPKRGEKRPA